MSAQGLLKTKDGYALIEMERWYPKGRRFGIFRGWRTIKRGKEFSISETMRPGGEDVVSALRRGIAEEWKLHIPKGTFNATFILNTRHPLRLSTVYPKLLTITHSTVLGFTLPKRPWLWDPITTDDEGGKTMLTFLEWIPPSNEKRSEKIVRSVLTVLFRFWMIRIRYLF